MKKQLLLLTMAIYTVPPDFDLVSVTTDLIVTTNKINPIIPINIEDPMPVPKLILED